MSEPFTNHLRLSQSERDRLFAQLGHDSGPKSGRCKRRHPRHDYRVLDVAVAIVHPGGGHSRLLVTSRNLSAGGIAFLHGGYLHAGSDCKLVLMRRDGSPMCLSGTVRHCRHLQGSCHEIGVQFCEEINPQAILLPENLENAARGPGFDRSLRIPALRGHVLVADDNTADRRLLAHQLAATGLDITPVDTAGAALDAVKLGRFDAVICGLDLHLAHGVHAVEQLRQIGYRRPILVLTAETEPRALGAVMAAGATEVAGKPYDPFYLMYLLAEALDQPASDGLIVSRLDGEPGMGELLKSFVEETKATACKLAAALEGGNLAQIRELCVRMAGSSANHGFDQLSIAARDALHNLDAAGRLAEATGPLRRLISMCRRLTGSSLRKAPVRRKGS